MVRLCRQKARVRLLLLCLLLSTSRAAIAAEDVLLLDVVPEVPKSAQAASAQIQPDVSQERAECTVLFIDHDQSILWESTLFEGDPITPPPVEPTRGGFVFLYWYDTAMSVPFSFGTPAVNSAVTLTALYAEIPKHPDTETPPPSFPRRGRPQETAEPRTESLSSPGILPDGELATTAASGAAGSSEALSNCSIQVFSSHTESIASGQLIQLWAELSGFEDLQATFQWQYYAGETWHDVQDATELYHAFVATPETVNYSWRLVASVVLVA